jgi:GNAT superfamily N-acetyltransferase
MQADPSPGHTYTVRKAVLADAALVARQRRQMFDALHEIPQTEGDEIEAAVRAYVERAIPAGTYHSWLVEHQGAAVAGGGIQLRTLMPRPGYVHGEPEGLIVSMWTEPEHRRKGLGKLVVEAILAWGRANGVTRFTLHASQYGQPLYEQCGFAPTNEMRLE